MLRRHLPAFLALVVVAAGCNQAPKQDTAADKTKMESDALAWFDAFAKADSTALAAMYTEDAVLMPPTAPTVTGRAAIQSALGLMATQTLAAKVTVKNNAVTGSEVCGDIGWISGTYTAADSTGNTIDTGSYLSIHHRVNGAWLYVRDIWNSDRPAAPAASAPMG